jgi:hypothetical protein
MGIEMFCNFIDDSIKKPLFRTPFGGDETKANSYNSQEFGIRNIRTISLSLSLKTMKLIC